jgi:hypothetical protein
MKYFLLEITEHQFYFFDQENHKLEEAESCWTLPFLLTFLKSHF